MPFVTNGGGKSFEIGGFLLADLGIGASHHGGSEGTEFELIAGDGDTAGKAVAGGVASDFAGFEERKAGSGIRDNRNAFQLEELPIGVFEGKGHRGRRRRGCGRGGRGFVSGTGNRDESKQKKGDCGKARSQTIPPVSKIATKHANRRRLADARGKNQTKFHARCGREFIARTHGVYRKKE